MASKKKDRVQPFRKLIAQTAANDSLISQVETSYSTKDKVGIEIVSVQWWPMLQDWTMLELSTASEWATFGLTQLYKGGNPPTEPHEAGVIDFETIGTHFGTAVGESIIHLPFIFTPPEPILVHPAALYMFMTSNLFDVACSVYMQMWYKYIDLSDQEFQDILQTIVLQDSL